MLVKNDHALVYIQFLILFLQCTCWTTTKQNNWGVCLSLRNHSRDVKRSRTIVFDHIYSNLSLMAENGDMTLTHDCRILILIFNSRIKLWKDWNPSERTYLQRWFANLPTKQNACFFYLNIPIFVFTKQRLSCHVQVSFISMWQCIWPPAADSVSVAEPGGKWCCWLRCCWCSGLCWLRRNWTEPATWWPSHQAVCVCVWGEKVWIHLSENRRHLAMVTEVEVVFKGKVHNFSNLSHTD